MKRPAFFLVGILLTTITHAQIWTPFGSGIANGSVNRPDVYSIFDHNDTLYAGGPITEAGGVTINGGLAMWTGLQWSDGGLSSPVMQMLEYNNQLYAIGGFGIERWTGSQWDSVGTGVSGSASAMCIYNNALYVAGLTTAGGATVYDVAKWDGAQWTVIGTLTGSITSLVSYNNLLYAFGGLMQIDGGTYTANGGAVWDTVTWSTIPNLPSSGFGGTPNVGPAIVYHDTLYMGADNNLYAYVNDSSHVFWTTNQYSPDALIFSLAVLFDKLYISLEVTETDYQPLPFVYGGISVQPVSGGGYVFGDYECQLVSSGMNAPHDYDFERLWEAPRAGFTANAVTACQGTAVTFADTVCQGVASQVWSFPGGTPNASTDENPTVVYAQQGTYAVSLILTNPVGSDTETVANYITVTATPATPTITPIGNILVTGASTGNQWYRNDTLLPNETSNTDTVPNTITFYQCYSVQVTSNGCTAVSDSVCFTPTTGVGITQVAVNTLTLYPNPTENSLVIANIQPGTLLTVTNLLGEIVMQKIAEQQTETLDVSRLASGMYFVNMAKFVKH